MNATMTDTPKAVTSETDILKRRKFVRKAKILGCAVLMISWCSHASSEDMSRRLRASKQEFIGDSMRYDLLTHGTAIGPYASSNDEIARRWNNVADTETQKWREEDNGKAINLLALLSFSALAVYCFFIPKGKQAIESYITNGIK